MLHRIGAAIVTVAVLGFGAVQAAPVEAYGRLPNIEDVTISPDGSLLAVSTSLANEDRVISIHKADDSSVISVLRMGKEKLRWVQWAGTRHLLITTSTTALVRDLAGPKREYWMTTSYDINTKKQSLLLANQPGAMNVVYGPAMIRKVGGDLTAFVQGIYFVENYGRVTLFAVNLDKNRTKMIEARSEDTDDWLVDAAGIPLAQSQYDQSKGVWSLRIKGDRGWALADQATSPMGSYGVSGLGRDGKSVLVAMQNADGDTVYREYAQGGGHADLPMERPFDGLIRDPATGALIGGVTLVGDDLRYQFYDAKNENAWKAVQKAFPGDRVSLASWSDDRRKIVVLVDSATEGPAYALVDLDKKSADWLGASYSSLTPADIGEVRPVKYKAADGLEITGYLTLPKGKSAKNLPLIVLPHGGPEGRDAPGFDWWSQGLASRGYAVLQPNFRGSEGFGQDFVQAGFGEWGKKMQTDLSDGVRYLAKEGLIDPKRVCVVGASYGGYAALAGATIDTGVYRCAVSVAGPSDLKRMLVDNQERYATSKNAAMRYWLRFMGADGVRDPDLAAISPAKLAAKADIPVLLIHGKDDTVVPYVQSKLMSEALTKAGKPVQFVTLDGEDHWLSRGASRQRMLTETVAFVEKHNPPN
ncbi:alpha/beta hydrolase family protein [Caulobacter endophyticus]|uniref:alpha/beta hydrolase family protein n=1 Tax=Caulobacter endophyticus TaxID=2172652 RepID=UPI00240F4714|nr:S9 family peptidase [Caulobacter endophyticus]MDG2527758.1 S9 family peptidase [Caulobacter endophyticus]